MAEQPNTESMKDQTPDELPEKTRTGVRLGSLAIKCIVLLVVFGIGLLSGYVMWGPGHEEMAAITAKSSASQEQDAAIKLMQQVNPPDGYSIPAIFGEVGPRLVAAGAIDMTKFTNLYEQQGKPLTDEQVAILTKGTDKNIIINPENAYFLLNFLWALGLANENAVLTEGPMMARGKEKVGSFASTGGWTLGKRNATSLYAGSSIMTLNEDQQKKLMDVAPQVFRPCCDNPTHFPDCNHGMAMLGLLELMASQDASEDQMFEAAKYVTAFWYPQQMLEVATAMQIFKSVDFAQADSRTVVSQQYASSSGFKGLHQWLLQNNGIQQVPSGGGSCGVQ